MIQDKAEIWGEIKDVCLIFTVLALLLSLSAEVGVNPFELYTLYWGLSLLGVIGVFTSVKMEAYYESRGDLQGSP